MKLTERALAGWQRVYAMSFASLYPMYIAKAEKKGRSKDEVDQVIRWLTGYTQKGIESEIAKKTALQTQAHLSRASSGKSACIVV